MPEKRAYHRSKPHQKLDKRAISRLKDLVRRGYQRKHIAQLLGVSPRHVYRLISQYRLGRGKV